MKRNIIIKYFKMELFNSLSLAFIAFYASTKNISAMESSSYRLEFSTLKRTLPKTILVLALDNLSINFHWIKL